MLATCTCGPTWLEWYARLAQSVEHQTFNLRVAGSSPSSGVTDILDYVRLSDGVIVLQSDNFRLVKSYHSSNGGLAQMVERSLSMREVPGSMPGSSNSVFFLRHLVGHQMLPIRLSHLPNITMSGWPSGLRRQTQELFTSSTRRAWSILVHECGRGFESHF